MAATHIIGFATIFVLSLVLESYANPEHIHTKHVIHAPLHIKLVHHHKIIKVPVVFRKHYHHHKHLSHENVYIPLKEKPKVVYEDGDEEGGYPPKVIKIIKAGGNQNNGDGDEGDGSHDYESRRYYSHPGGRDDAELGPGPHRSEENSYEYDESGESAGSSSYHYHGIH